MIKIDPEFLAFIPKLNPDESARLEAQLVAAGRATDPLTTWRGFLVDGHNRYEICTRHKLPYTTIELDVPDRAAVKAWMFQHQLGRRNLTDDQIVMLAALSGQSRGDSTLRGTPRQWTFAKELAARSDVERVQKVTAGLLPIALAHRLVFPPPPKPKPLPPLPAMMPEGHRLKGTSVLRGPDGTVNSQWDKSELDSSDPPAFEPVPEGHHVGKVSTLLDSQGNVRAQWIQAPHDKIAQEQSFWDACKKHTEEYKGIAPLTKAPRSTDAKTLTLYPLGDPHIGMLSWHEETGQNFDLKIAERDLTEVVRKLVATAPASERAVLANVGDFFHADDDSQLTPGHGHKLDVDCRSGKVFRLGCALMRTLIDLLLKKHKAVDVRNVPGNHDPKTSRMLAMWLAAVYENEPRVLIEPNLDPFSYLEFGANLFGFTHGENVKADKLVGVMATDQKEAWGRTTHRLWVTGHVHHESRKEYPGCMVETYNTLAARDYWHHSKGYRSDRKLFAITFDELLGEVARSTVRLTP